MKIGTHNGVFHADDVLAAAMLRLINPTAEIVRTRDEAKLAECQIVFDVGAKYDPATCRYDHHQRERAGTRPNGILYSSLGLVWKHHGLELCDGNEDVHCMVDEHLVQPVDALDNGQKMYEGVVFADRLPYTISQALSSMNPNWYEEADFDAAFGQAVEVAQVILRREINSARGTVLAEEVAREAINSATDPRVIVLDRFCPWQNVVVPEAPQALFVLFPSETGDWRIQAIPPTLGSFEKRRSLPAAWAGLRADALAELTGVSDSIFCHAGLFIAGAQSKEGVLELARLALED